MLVARGSASESGTNDGRGTFFYPGLGACGVTNSNDDLIVAVGHDLFDTFPGANGNSNDNPICKKSITANFEGKSVTVKVTDRCVGCNSTDLDFSPAAFAKLADLNLGEIGMTWSFDD
ncbi:barwin-like endoglucanase [Dentipellis sp. KUC8613]|nr:barwin-like endoglucanase [Dentipellis sp. KUC8613]